MATSQLIRPAGDSLEIEGRPVDLVLSADGSRLFVKDDRGLVVADARSWRTTAALPFPEGGGSMHGIAASRDGARAYLTSAQHALWVASISIDGRARWVRKVELPGPGGKGESHACGLALSADETTAWVCLSRNNSLAEVDLAAAKLVLEIPVGVAPFDVVLSPDGRLAFVSDWGGRRPAPGERTARSAGTDVLVDERGVARSGAVSVVDLALRREVAVIDVGLHPSDLEVSADGSRLFAANANSDTVSVIDVPSRRVIETIDVHPDPTLAFGSAPNGLALGPGGGTLFVANGGNNAVAVVAPSDAGGAASRVVGLIPAGWYPGAVAANGETLFVANVKGTGARRKTAADPGWYVTRYLGSVSRVPIPGADALARMTAQARDDARVPEALRAFERAASDTRPVPVPARLGEPSVFEHVVYVIKENRTYDQVLGDLGRGNGDASLCIFGRDVTPNHHALAEEFVLLDNFYCNGVVSADGHSWATEGNVTDHLEKSFGGFTRSYTWGDDPLTYSSSGFLWDDALLHGLSFRNYGEMDYAKTVPEKLKFLDVYRDYTSKAGKVSFRQDIGIENLRRYSVPGYPGWNLGIPDVLRADVFLEDLREHEARGEWPSLVIVYLPNDHTSGTSPGSPTPRAQVADNDVALGRVIEGITRSRFWQKTCVFVIEDDPQDGFDHVDGHRSLCLVASPYTRRGAVVSKFYNQTSVLHTMERILGIPPMNQMDAMAPLMSECFTESPDPRPYEARPGRIALDEMNPPLTALRGEARHWAEESLEEDFDGFDEADEDTLNRILWHSVKGSTPYPAELAGAHGKGLRALRLELEGQER